MAQHAVLSFQAAHPVVHVHVKLSFELDSLFDFGRSSSQIPMCIASAADD